MNATWHLFEEKKPLEGVILLVNGPLGLDLAVTLKGNLYFKKGDDWSVSNIEYWCFNAPTQWAEFTLPGRSGSCCGKVIFDNRDNNESENENYWTI